jgi:hypothetical protein
MVPHGFGSQSQTMLAPLCQLTGTVPDGQVAGQPPISGAGGDDCARSASARSVSGMAGVDIVLPHPSSVAVHNATIVMILVRIMATSISGRARARESEFFENRRRWCEPSLPKARVGGVPCRARAHRGANAKGVA